MVRDHNGRAIGHFRPGKLLGVVRALSEGGPWLFRQLTRNRRAQFPFTRREGTVPWFALVGIIANGTWRISDSFRGSVILHLRRVR